MYVDINGYPPLFLGITVLHFLLDPTNSELQCGKKKFEPVEQFDYAKATHLLGLSPQLCRSRQMPDEYDDPTFDSLGLKALNQLPSHNTGSFPLQPVPQAKLRAGFNAIIVNARQKGNSVLAGVKTVPWEYGDITPDFVLGQTCSALFLSLKYHRLHPEYIYTRMRDLGKSFSLRIMLVLCDIDNHTDSLRELSKTCVVNGYTLIVAWSTGEAGRYLETYKSLESAPSDAIKEKRATAYSDQVVECLTSIRAVNKSDAYALIGTFGSVARAFRASMEEVGAVGGWGPQKIRNFEAAVHSPWRVRSGTSKSTSDAVIGRSIRLTTAGEEMNGDFGPGKDHSASRTQNASTGLDGAGAHGTAEDNDDDNDDDKNNDNDKVAKETTNGLDTTSVDGRIDQTLDDVVDGGMRPQELKIGTGLGEAGLDFGQGPGGERSTESGTGTDTGTGTGIGIGISGSAAQQGGKDRQKRSFAAHAGEADFDPTKGVSVSAEAEAEAEAESGSEPPKHRNAEYAGVLASLAKLREASGYSA